ncbi:carbohydrate ABC transporter substrate-binding protein (CUT1 family) [Halanaerobium saccharolyticum]|uniref:Carbohydrate ABC transporter substrate-binding protein (CUT1 family) n=1 Tax=Halanaerobium saccharolyticum TaxID=43595 RepID=A0A4R7YXQ7_9FIRM|nr:extracellular solute-binding protein [Halanaerobium saccharolyticum]RAK07193.1 carbohydrate ABC transporter substrate-binding protein (CUT1 family) [Halanaerobium saccharolyticum]TDW02106.1 carbohydrate ABC transporter substrate-binding protein (CUT1 family) [Halanaerobium saccharolyticum]TDX58837.1 carbohydrate ABC transporter substrate-binding protein (CUT1 family) [Halanaerobium saccharolyticum]
MKKVLILSLTLLMVFSFVFAGSVMAQDEVTLTLWDIRTAADQATPAVKDAIERFEADNPNVTIEHVPTQNDNYKTKLRTAMSADNAPDLFMTWGSASLERYVDADKVYSLESNMTEDWENNFMLAALDLGRVDNEMYGVPVTNVSPALVWYRTDLFEEYDLEVPETYDELLNVVETFTENGITPFALANSNKWPGSMYFMYLVDRIGGPEALQNAISREGAFNDEAFIEAGRRIQELVEMGAFPDGVNGLDENAAQSRTLLYTDRAAMYLMGSWAYSSFKNEASDMVDQFSFFNFPEIESGAGDPSNLVGTPGDNYYSVSTQAPNKEAAVEFLKYLTDSQMGEQLIEIGNIPPFTGVGEKIEDPIMKKIYDASQNANHIQLWYDQTLPLELAQVHLNTTQALFGMEMTPEEAADQMEEAAQEYYSE